MTATGLAMSGGVRIGLSELIRTALCAIVILISTIVLLGWILAIPALTELAPGFLTMKANTAVGLSASGLAVLVIRRGPMPAHQRLLPVLLGALVAVIGALTLIEYLSGASLGIDELLFGDPNAPLRAFAGRMSPAAAVAFVPLGVGIIVLAAGNSARTIGTAHGLAAAPAAVGYLFLTVYAYNVENIQNIGPFAAVAASTALGLSFLSAAIMLTKPNLGWASAYRDRPYALRLLLRLMGLALVVPFVAGILIVSGVRLGLYPPLFGPALFAMIAAVSFGASAVHTAGLARRGEEALLTAREDIRRQENLAVETARDISERRRVEEIKDTFVATVSHELRTPLTSIAGSLGLLKGGAGGQLPPRAARLVEIAESNSSRLIRLVNNILDMEKIRSETAVFNRHPVQLKALAITARDAMSGLAFDRAIVLSVDDIDPMLAIMADQDRMMQVLSNLISNAIKVSRTGTIVRIAGEARDGYGRILIIDQGPGVPTEFQGRIFDRFAQADNTDGRNIGGTGLGLSIVKEIVERHEGKVDYRSTLGEGATFFFDIPLVKAPDGVHLAPTPSVPLILICEDDELIAEVLVDQLEFMGYRAETVSTANEARHALYTGNYNALISDIRLPDSDGVTLMRALRAVPATVDLPIIAISGSEEFRTQAEALGVVDWLSKPIAMDRLSIAVERALAAGKATKPLILYVDNDADLVELARGRLGGVGELVGASSLGDAKATLSKRRPDLVILELDLQDGSGEAILEELRRMDGPAVPVILYTARDITSVGSVAVDAVLIKSQSDLPTLAKVAKRLLEEVSDGKAQIVVH